MTYRCAKCRGIIQPNEECLIDDNGKDIHAACPTLFRESESAGYADRPGFFTPAPDKGAT